MYHYSICGLLFLTILFFNLTTNVIANESENIELGTKNVIPVFMSTFESGSLTPDIGGQELINLKAGGTLNVVENPYPNGRNTSSKVMRASIPPGESVRAEYHNGTRLEVNEKSYIYTWKTYFPANYLSNANVSWLVYSQWKTHPCGNYDNPKVPPYDTANYGKHICESGGIFNDIEQSHGEKYTYDLRFRANPDCNKLSLINTQGEWHTFIKEIYWTNTNNGYYRIFKDGELLLSVDNVKTLFDQFPADLGICDMYWGLGLYANWTSEGLQAISVFIDDMKVYDKDDGISVFDICPECQGNGSIFRLISGALFKPDDTGTKQNIKQSQNAPDPGITHQ